MSMPMKAAATKSPVENIVRPRDRSVLEFPRTGTVERRNTELIGEYQRSRDSELLETIVNQNQGLLHTVLRRFSYFPDPYEDLLQVANLGLIKAIQRFDPCREIQFSSYATAIVDGEIRHHLRDNVLMRQPRWLRKEQKRIENVAVELTRRLKRRPTVDELSQAVNISTEGIMEILKMSADSVFCVDDVCDERLEQLPNADAVHSLHYESFILPIEDRIALEEAIDTLSALHKKLVYLLFYKDLTQTEVAQKLGLNQRKVSRESAKALVKLKTVLNTRIF